MKREQIMQVIRNLAKSQGFQGRLLYDIQELQKNDPEEADRVLSVLEAQKFNDALDVILYFEQQEELQCQ